ncbi:acetoacetate decarboxylase [Salpingoeca rosetta]|uniref:Acetoacetate decarboxylase n=1 Tax=Salpingoeca rosetta (strain ATCC 50818 / BSB-021) TaxID=946362 RepID=F2UKZ4_SALR5|nr:acetoacetate decarboxylase [Salpingoeca rosetta]EGD77793.1 acetoacetate decarboxylase [Salpingoeca rosetta]|eukprot:XP_004990269.1 acetoacetate decarboxylase [Salpingoeca rosetta]
MQRFTRAFAVYNHKQFGEMTRQAILALPSIPSISPSYPKGPFHFRDREYFIVEYETDIKRLKQVVPWPLVPASNRILYEWINMPDSSGFGSYSESGCVVPCLLNGEAVNYTLSMYLDDEPPTAAGRELWGFPKRHAMPSLRTEKDTLVGVLKHAGQLAVMGTMAFKHQRTDPALAADKLSRTTCNLRLIPDVNGGLTSAQLVGFNLEDVEVKEAWTGPARLHLNPHVTAPASNLPVRRIIGGTHMKTNLTLPLGRVMYDYKNPAFEYTPDDHDDDHLSPAKVLKAPAMPIMAPSYPRVLNHIHNRESLFIKYNTTREAILANLPYNVEANDDNVVLLSWSKTESTGIGAYNKFNVHIPCRYNGEEFLFAVLSVMDSGVTLNAGREIYGQPCKYGFPSLFIDKDTLSAKLAFGEQECVAATSLYKHSPMTLHDAAMLASTPELNLKFIPGVSGAPDVAQLVAIRYGQPELDTSVMHKSTARVALFPHVNAPVADFLVMEQSDCWAYHMRIKHCKLQGEVVHDYLLQE